MSTPILRRIFLAAFAASLLFCDLVKALQFDQAYFSHNLNQAITATNPLDYAGIWTEADGSKHKFFPSPTNWRMPFYTLFLDRFVDGDPSNNNANGTQFEHDPLQTDLRHGGDVQGLIDSLDYIQGTGIGAIYIAGTPFINLPWAADAYSPLDLTLLDAHFGDITTWQNLVTEVHKRGMYIMLDSTVATMGDLLISKGFENATVPFDTKEHDQSYRDPSRRYTDFVIDNRINATCAYPRFWLETGFPVGSDVTSQLTTCRASEFDHYGDFKGIGDFDGWKRSLSKATGVQDRLREWVPSVREKIDHFSCLLIQMLDIDGMRIDKSTQTTVDALASYSQSLRACAAALGKNNFMISGEISGGNTYGSIFLGRGKQPDMVYNSQLEAVTASNATNSSAFIRDVEASALDGAAFHYSVYRALQRILGMDGVISGPFDTGVNLAEIWNDLLRSNDMVNVNTGKFDPLHIYGTTNQDNFRWSSILNGTQKMLLGQFLTTLGMPGSPSLWYGEEQAMYLIDSTTSDFLFGRQSMSSAQAWQNHGCYKIGSLQFNDFVVDGAPAKDGCSDDWNSLDHRDPSNPVRNIIKSMYQMRKNYLALNDGWTLSQLSNKTRDVFLPASNGTATETGLWSFQRSNFEKVQDLGAGNQSVWLVWTNENKTVDYTFDCASAATSFVAPFDANTTVRNLFPPHDIITLGASSVKLGVNGSPSFSGCVSKLKMAPWEFRAYVPVAKFVAPGPMITKFLPGHDARLVSTNAIPIEIHLSAPMNCSTFVSSISVKSTTEDGKIAKFDPASMVCTTIPAESTSQLIGAIPTTWTLKGTLTGVSDGVHVVTIKDITPGSADHFFLRVGAKENPIVFPGSANYSTALFGKASDGTLMISHRAAGATQFRYSLDFGTTYSAWLPYTGGNTTLSPKQWSGTSEQAWSGEHVIVQYHSNALGSSDHVQHGDIDFQGGRRFFPHLFVQGDFNQFGTDPGYDSKFSVNGSGVFEYPLLTEWPSDIQFNVWGINPDGQADKTAVFGDVDGDNVLDRLPPTSLLKAQVRLFNGPESPFLSWKLIVNDATMRYEMVGTGNRWNQLIVYILMWTIPSITASLGVWLYVQSFYKVKFNKTGIQLKTMFPLAFLGGLFKRNGNRGRYSRASKSDTLYGNGKTVEHASSTSLVNGAALLAAGDRRRVLIATMEYDIEDWAIKIKIGGLGVMAQLMGKSLSHQDLIWVVPCVGGIEYPVDEPAGTMDVTIMGKQYSVNVQYHVLRNITYVLLDAPIFRAQSKSEPYPERMDDIDSAIYYSTWNQCIALTIKRFQPDIYHINDYHGSLAPVYLLPETIPCALSLHNAEFQGLWAMRSPEESKEVCDVYNISQEVAQKYVQFGDVFNLLHAGASYLRVHQKGFGAVGVSNKYGTRAWARYPIFWGLSKIGALPNPDPSDVAEWKAGPVPDEELIIDQEFEASRADLRKQAQEWAGLEVDPTAELLVFVGRWSMQKGIDLIADVMPALLDENPKVQLITVGPTIDLYGKFAALKFDVLMKKYPGRVCSKPVFTALPPFIFSGAEFALIPSRDEPFGLVAVEFGRKGALGIGARVGGLGQMPGWWFTVESSNTAHMLSQFKKAIKEALGSNKNTRVKMRARSAKQRFPVAQWVASLETLQSTAIDIHQKEAAKPKKDKHSRGRGRGRSPRPGSVASTTDTSYRPRSMTLESRDRSRGVSERRSSSFDTRRSSTSSSLTLNEPARPIRALSPNARGRGLSDAGSAHVRAKSPLAGVLFNADDEAGSSTSSPNLSPDPGQMRPKHRRHASSQSSLAPTLYSGNADLPSVQLDPYDQSDDEGDESDGAQNSLLPPSGAKSFYQLQNTSTLSVKTIVQDRQDLELQQVEMSFTDKDGEYYQAFEQMLQDVNAGNSEGSLCIEQYLIDSEKAWFNRFRDAKLGKTPKGSPAPSVRSRSRAQSLYDDPNADIDAIDLATFGRKNSDEFQLGFYFEAPRGFRKWLQYKVFDWPLYTILLALGQIMAANSFQITLLAGPSGNAIVKFYVVLTIYIVSSAMWWLCYRRIPSLYVLSTPFLLYGLAFLLLGIVPFIPRGTATMWLQNVATGSYTIASASGSLFFALNFGDEGGSPTKSWVWRACIIQGTQQVYITALWFWGSHLANPDPSQNVATLSSTSKTTSAALLPIAAILFFIGIILYFGLPSYYRQTPGSVPDFYISLLRRNIILWFLFTVLVQNFFMSTLAGRNWAYLWASKAAPLYQIALLAVFFFLVVWVAVLWLFGRLAMTHTWILPIFAIGLGAPRWVQILWSCTPLGSYLPWAGSPIASALLGRALWLFLGLLDALQGVGFGMILLQTLTRLHISATLIGAQILGAAITIVARAAGPSKVGPGPVFPDISRGASVLANPWFVIGLFFQLLICAGFFKFFRKEQLSKP